MPGLLFTVTTHVFAQFPPLPPAPSSAHRPKPTNQDELSWALHICVGQTSCSSPETKLARIGPLQGLALAGSALIQTIQALPAVLSLSLPAILADGFPGGDPLSSRRAQIGSPQLMKQLAPGGGLLGCERTSLRSRNPAKAFPRPKSLQLLLPNKRGRPDVGHRSVRPGQSNTPRLVPTINILCLHSLHDLDLLDTAVVRSCPVDQGHLGGHLDFFQLLSVAM